jgi:hypothetical protein
MDDFSVRYELLIFSGKTMSESTGILNAPEAKSVGLLTKTVAARRTLAFSMAAHAALLRGTETRKAARRGPKSDTRPTMLDGLPIIYEGAAK